MPLTLTETQDGITRLQPLHVKSNVSSTTSYSLQLKMEAVKGENFGVVVGLVIDDEALSYGESVEVSERAHVSATLKCVVVLRKKIN